MRKTMTIMSVIMGLVVAGCISPANCNAKSQKCNAKSQKAFYYCDLYSSIAGDDSANKVTSVDGKGKKIVIKGSFSKAKSFKKYLSGKYKKVKDKTFKLGAKCKYTYTTGKGGAKVSKSRFFKLVKKEWGPAFTMTFNTDNSGKIAKIDLDVSM